MIDFDEPLSPAGQARREQILGVAQRAARRTRLRRHALRGLSACALLAIGTWAVMQGRAPRPADIALLPPATHPIAAVSDVKIEWIDDDELLASLAQAGEQAGLIRMDGQTLLITPDFAQ